MGQISSTCGEVEYKEECCRAELKEPQSHWCQNFSARQQSTYMWLLSAETHSKVFRVSSVILSSHETVSLESSHSLVQMSWLASSASWP